MENQVQLFNVEEFGAVRFIIIDNEPWFVAADVCKILGIQNIRQNLAALADDEKCVITLPTNGVTNSVYNAYPINDAIYLADSSSKNSGWIENRINVVNEPGLYRLIFASRKPEAEKLKRKVYHEILPSIRKTGMYIADPALRKRLEHIKETEQWSHTAGLSPKLKKYYADAAETLMKEFAERSLALDEKSKLAYSLREKNFGTEIDTPHFLRQFITDHCDFDSFSHVPAEIFIKLLREEYPTSTVGYTNRQAIKDLRCVKGITIIRDSYSTCVFGIKFKAQNLP